MGWFDWLPGFGEKGSAKKKGRELKQKEALEQENQELQRENQELKRDREAQEESGTTIERDDAIKLAVLRRDLDALKEDLKQRDEQLKQRDEQLKQRNETYDRRLSNRTTNAIATLIGILTVSAAIYIFLFGQLADMRLETVVLRERMKGAVNESVDETMAELQLPEKDEERKQQLAIAYEVLTQLVQKTDLPDRDRKILLRLIERELHGLEIGPYLKEVEDTPDEDPAPASEAKSLGAEDPLQ